MALALDEGSQQRIKQVRDFLHDYTRLRYTVLAIYGLIGFVVWWTIGGDIEKYRNRVGTEKQRQVLIEDLRAQKKFTDSLGTLLPAPDGHDLPWYMDQFSAAAQKSGVQLDKALPKPTGTRLGNYPICGFSLEAVGSYQGLVRFVDNIENIKPLVKMERVEIEELVGEAIRLLTVDMLPGERKATVTITVLMSPKAM